MTTFSDGKAPIDWPLDQMEGHQMKRYFAALALGAMTLTSAPAQATELYIGQVFQMAGNYCPRGSLEADGRMLDISRHTALFSVLGTTYGGDGRTSFGLPDLNRPTREGRRGRLRMLECIVVNGTYPPRS